MPDNGLSNLDSAFVLSDKSRFTRTRIPVEKVAREVRKIVHAMDSTTLRVITERPMIGDIEERNNCKVTDCSKLCTRFPEQANGIEITRRVHDMHIHSLLFPPMIVQFSLSSSIARSPLRK